MRYMLIHCVDDDVAEGGHLDEHVQRELSEWLKEMSDRGVLKHGGQLLPVRTATTVRVRNHEVLLVDGPFAETKEQVAGYDVLDCADLDEALEIASRHPTARLGMVEVRPFLGFHEH
jgi:hypothetical protein